MREDEDRACFDCAAGSHLLCLEDDPAEVGRRSCCCGAEDEIPMWGDE
jgi:hypothetical protein